MESWDDPTESVLGAFDDRSLELDIDFSSLPPTGLPELSADGVLAELWPDATRRGELEPDVVVFDPMAFELARRLISAGFRVREASSGVDVMTLVAARPTGAVVCGPAEDAERRRLLTAALRLRFPTVPVVYISTHARNPAAVKGALAEGAEIVMPLPLPADEELRQALRGFVRAVRPQALPDPSTGPLRPPGVVYDDPSTVALSAEELAAQRARYAAFGGQPGAVGPGAGGPGAGGGSGRPVGRAAPPPMPNTDSGIRTPPIPARIPGGPTGAPPPAGSPLAAPAARGPLAVPPPTAPSGPHPMLDDGGLAFDSEVPTDVVMVPSSLLQDPRSPPVAPMPVPARGSPPLVPAGVERPGSPLPKTNPTLNGEVGQLLGAISPFLWGLEDAARYVESLSEKGDSRALTHARTLKLLAKLLTQLKERVDDLGL